MQYLMVKDLSRRINNVVTRAMPFKMVRSHADKPLASITFDDFPKSAWTVAGPVLAEYEARATYYAAGSFRGRSVEGIEYYDADDLLALRQAGHEVGCHSFSHQRAPTVSSAALLAEAEANAEALREQLGDDVLSNYAYPFGGISPRTKALFARRFASARGIRPGINCGWIDLAQLKAIPLVHWNWRPSEIDRALEAANRSAGWVIFYTHDVSDTPSSFGCTPGMLAAVLERLKLTDIEVLPVKHAMARALLSRQPQRLSPVRR
jgi:peptidoglycan/xylan/chitin deacetylase (PgdA/CDA1 family)